MGLDREIFTHRVVVPAAFAALYFVFPSVLSKPLIILYLAWIAHTSSPTVCWGLLLSAGGDISLELERPNNNLFIVGLLFFLSAHIAYIIYFWSYCRQLILLSALPFMVYYILLVFLLLLPHIPPALVVPVIIYGAVICSMAAVAAMRCSQRRLTRSDVLGFFGALFFVLSDTVLALNKFVMPFDTTKHLIMITYYVGQWLITLSSLRTDVQKQ